MCVCVANLLFTCNKQEPTDAGGRGDIERGRRERGVEVEGKGGGREKTQKEERQSSLTLKQ